MKDLLLLVKNNFTGLTGKDLIKFLRSNVESFNFFFGSRSSKTELVIKVPFILKDKIIELFSEAKVREVSDYYLITVDTDYSITNLSVITLLAYLKKLSEVNNLVIEAYNNSASGGVNHYHFTFDSGKYIKNLHLLSNLNEEDTLDSLGEICYRCGYTRLSAYLEFFEIK